MGWGLTLDGPLEEGFAGLTGCHTIVVAGGHIPTDQAEAFGQGAEHQLPTTLLARPSPIPILLFLVAWEAAGGGWARSQSHGGLRTARPSQALATFIFMGERIPATRGKKKWELRINCWVLCPRHGLLPDARSLYSH